MKKILVLLLVIVTGNSFSQGDAEILNRLISNDSSVVTVLFSYPDSIRTVLFKASAYPQGFVRLDEIQKATAASFQKTASKYSREKQEQLWDLVRYPGLIPYLVKNRDQAGTDDFLKRYPSKTQAAALDFAKHEHETLLEIQDIRSDFETRYKEVTRDFPAEVRNAFNTLLKFPEIIDVLSANMKTTVTIGDIYKRDPALLKHKADSLNLEMARQKAIEYEDWKKTVSADTASGNELKKVSDEYAKEQPDESGKYSDSEYNVIVTYNYAPYPYWCGYPYWYGAPHWYPYPWWYQCGYYWPDNGPIIFIGLPTYYFGWWYFHKPHHHYYYPRTSNHFYHHYEGHRGSTTAFTHSVRDWEGRNSNSLRPGWLNNDDGRTERFREFGRTRTENNGVERSPAVRPVVPEHKPVTEPVQKPERRNNPVSKPAENKRPAVKPEQKPVPRSQPGAQPKIERKRTPQPAPKPSGKK